MEATKATQGEGLIFPESIEDRGIGVKTWIGVGRGVGGTPSCITITCFFRGWYPLMYQYNMIFFGGGYSIMY